MRHDVIETTMDAVMADAVMEATGAQIALTNGFRFAAVIEPGPITEADLWNAYPFSEPLRVGRITGAQFRVFWERELDYVLSRNPDVQFGGWLPRVAGVTLRFNPVAPAGKRIVALEVQGKPIEAQRFYTLASCRREGDPPDTLCRIPDAQEVHDLSIDVHQAIRRYLAAHDPLPAPKMDRVVGIGLPQAVHSQYFDLHP
jgi:5'-nucleotidase